ncbi:MAG: capsule biosynthesis protein CapI [Deltaproteobacteria bacterium RIFOXYA12_FULL_61_11]|nr:MAG: capsule biosynthesis protein CapI [Deltaproteobacteria bacterium RIFOXYA12_FULL_61_11]
MKVLVTGAAGFIGYHLVGRCLAEGYDVVGLDCINHYYDPAIKYARLGRHGLATERLVPGTLVQSELHPAYRFVKLQLEERQALHDLFAVEKFDAVCHLAAQAGVRYSLKNPYAYLDSNYHGFLNILEGCRHNGVGHLVYASSSSVYGLNQHMPFSTSDSVDHPVSLYAASKKANELMAHAYAYLYGLPTTGLRFFTVYGPWGRPDMALFLFTQAILAGRPIDVFNHGDMERDFTYIDDIVEGLHRVLRRPPSPSKDWDPERPDPAASPAPYALYNIGNGAPVRLLDYIEALERELGRTAERNFLPLQAGDVPATFADTTALLRDFDYRPATPVAEGIRRFVAWYREFYAC